MWRKTFRNSCSASASAACLFLLLLLSGCSANRNCGLLEGVFDEPDCNTLKLTSTTTYIGTNASCAGSPNSRKLVISCAAGSGSQNQCSSLSNGLPAFSLVVPNNNGGTFRDADGTIYSTCQDLLTAYSALQLQNIAGIYISDSSAKSTDVSCTDAGGCTLTSPSCYAGWNASANAPSGTATLPLGNQYLACTYIDTSTLGSNPPIIAAAKWASGFNAVTVGGDLTFSSGWVDAY
jgi:hypothetical protein